MENSDQIDAGFDFIFLKGPRSNVNLQQLRWASKQTRDKSSPVYNWPLKVVERALGQLGSQGSLATTRTFFFPTHARRLRASHPRPPLQDLLYASNKGHVVAKPTRHRQVAIGAGSVHVTEPRLGRS